ncbi:MAG: GntR family transcriptional regulator [Burkholderiales bacterium]|nr:GntR family transcriptional regulator [Burkholderiales bacterium]
MSASSPSRVRPARALPAARVQPALALSATTATRVAADLRRRILAGELRPGQRLKLDELATLCEVSHMPVREALRELEGEGVLDVQPHRGATIRGVDARFVRNFYDLRGAIEGMLSGRCAERIDDDGLRALREAARDVEAAAARSSAGGIVAANRRFHDLINAAADNPEALRTLERGRVLADALRLRFGYGSGRVDAILAEHAELVRAIGRRDAGRAAAIAQRHCLRARDDMLARMGEPATRRDAAAS